MRHWEISQHIDTKLPDICRDNHYHLNYLCYNEVSLVNENNYQRFISIYMR